MFTFQCVGWTLGKVGELAPVQDGYMIVWEREWGEEEGLPFSDKCADG